MNEDQKWLLGGAIVLGGLLLWGREPSVTDQVLVGPDQPEKPPNERKRNRGLLDSRDPGSPSKMNQSPDDLKREFDLASSRLESKIAEATRSRSTKRSSAPKLRTSKKISTETVPLIEPSVSKDSNSPIQKYPPEYYTLNKKQQWKFRKKMQNPG